MNHSDQFGEQN